MATAIIYADADAGIYNNHAGDGSLQSASVFQATHTTPAWGWGDMGYGAVQRAFVAFHYNVAGSLPSGAVISYASWNGYGYQGLASPTDNYTYLLQCNNAFSEAGTACTSWSAIGLPQFTYGANSWRAIAVTGQAQNWLASPGTNYGVGLGFIPSNAIFSYNTYIYTREAGAPNQTYLSVTYNRPPNQAGAWTYPAGGETFNNQITNAQHGTATDPDGDAVEYLWYYLPGPAYSAATLIGTYSSAGPRNIDTTAWANGSYKLRSIARDTSAYTATPRDSNAFNVSHVQILSPGGVASAEAHGGPTIVPGPRVLEPAGVGSGEAVGSPTLNSIINLLPNAIATGEAHGPIEISTAWLLDTLGIESEEASGTPGIVPGEITLQAVAVDSAESVGLPHVAFEQFVEAVAIDSAEAAGNPELSTHIVVGIAALASAEATGSPTLELGEVVLVVGSIASGYISGTVRVVPPSVITIPEDMAPDSGLILVTATGSLQLIENWGDITIVDNDGEIRIIED